MILGIDHIAVSASDLASQSKGLLALGFTPRLAHESVPNDWSKMPWLKSWQPQHDQAILDGRAGVSLEITVHGTDLAIGSHLGFVPVICSQQAAKMNDQPPEGMECIVAILNDASGTCASWHPIPALKCGAWWMSGDGPEVVGAVQMVSDLQASVTLMTDGLGFNVVSEEPAGHS